MDVSSTFDRVVDKRPPRYDFKGSQSDSFANTLCSNAVCLITKYYVVVLFIEKLNDCYIRAVKQIYDAIPLGPYSRTTYEFLSAIFS